MILHGRAAQTCNLGAALLVLLAGASCSSQSSSAPAPAARSVAAVTSSPDSDAAPAVVLSSSTYRTEPWAFENKPGRVLLTPSYRLYTTTEQPILLERMPAFLEAAMAHYRTALGDLPAPSSPLESYLLANRPQWVRFTQRLMGDQADPFLRIQRGGYSTRGKAVLYDVGMRDTFSLASHEGWHQFTQRTFQQPLPTWLEEGIATYMEGFRWDQKSGGVNFLPWANVERFEQLRTACTSGTLMPVRELLSTSPQQLLGAGRLKQAGAEAALTYYAQVWSLVHFLREGAGGKYREELAGLLRDASRGQLDQRLLSAGGTDTSRMYLQPRRGPEFFRLALHADMDQIQSEYDQFVARLVQPGAKQKIVAGESPVTP